MTTAATEERVFRRDDYQGVVLAPPVELGNGWVRVEAKISRVGLQEYEDGDGVHMELRLPEEVFAPESLASGQMVPVTDTHPPVLLDDTNTTTFQKGQAGENVRQLDETWVAAPLMIVDRTLKQNARNGRNQISVGYTCKLIPTTQALIDKWGPHKYVQTKIVFNHIAFVDEARAGPEARARLDSRAAIMRNPFKVDSARSPTELRMAPRLRIGKTLTLDMIDGNVDALQAAIDREIADAMAKSDTALSVAEKAKVAAETRARVILDNAKRLLGKLSRIRTLVDAKKAMMASCDECGGSGKVPDDSKADDEGAMKTCDFCDGEGSYRMHSAVGGKAGAEADGDDPEGDLEEEVGEETDADELEVEQETEANAGAANTDGKARAKRRADSIRKRREAYETQQKELAASRQRMMDRAIRSRVKLVDSARPVLGDDFDFSKLDALAIKRKVVETLTPNAKLDGKTPAQIGERFDAEMERFTSGGADAVQTVDKARGSTVVVDSAQVRQPGAGGALRGRDKFLARNAEIAQTGKFDEAKWGARK